VQAASSSSIRTSVGVLEILERRRHLLLLLVIAFLVPRWAMQLTGDRLSGDELATARMAVNLVHHGILSNEYGPDPRETMYREPVPPVTAAAGVLLADSVLGEAPIEEYFSGERARYLKYHHVFWKALAVAGTYALIVALGAPWPAALAGALLLGTRPDLDTLNTELEAGALLAVGTAALVVGLRRRSIVPLAAAGAVFGLTALTKAAFLYVFVGLLAAVAAAMWLMPDDGGRRESPRRILASVAVLAAGFGVVTLPWMYRNYVKLDAFEISSRAGIVLHLRATHNRMTWDEYKGAFYVWSRPSLKPLVGAITGYDETDLAIGGRLQRLNRSGRGEIERIDLAAELAGKPEEALTYYREARAERVRLVAELGGRLDPRAAERAADRELARRAIDSMLAEPLRHLAMTVPLTWRGAPIYVPVLLIVLAYALKGGRRELLITAVLCTGFIAFYALFTHFEVRYSAPLKPLMGALAIVMLTEAWRLFSRRAGGPSG